MNQNILLLFGPYISSSYFIGNLSSLSFRSMLPKFFGYLRAIMWNRTPRGLELRQI